jgi:hypothetical protein
MELTYSALREPKAGYTEAQCEDAYAVGASSGIVAVSDGAGSAFESGSWARTLSGEFARAPFPSGRNDFLEWSGKVAANWSDQLQSDASDWTEAMKVSEGSAATLVGARFEEPTPGNGQWWCVALGDSCLFQVSAGRLVAATPLSQSASFDTSPPLVYTEQARTRQAIKRLALARGSWTTGDSFYLLTDAIAEWFLREKEQGRSPWDMLAKQDSASFAPFVEDLRGRRQLRNDDVTAVIVTPQSSRKPPRPAEPRRPEDRTGPQSRPSTGGPGKTERSKTRSSSTVSANEAQPSLDGEPRTRPGSGLTPPNGNQELVTAAQGSQDRPPPGPPGNGGPKHAVNGSRTARRRLPALAVPLIVGLLLGLLIGRFALGGNPTPSSPATDPAITTESRAFATALTNFNGNLTAYDNSLGDLATPDVVQQAMSAVNSGTFTTMSSKGSVDFVYVEPQASSQNAQVDVVTTQTITDSKTKQPVTRNLLLGLQLSNSVGGWEVTGMKVYPATGLALPQPTQPPAQQPSHSGGTGNTGKTGSTNSGSGHGTTH